MADPCAPRSSLIPNPELREEGEGGSGAQLPHPPSSQLPSPQLPSPQLPHPHSPSNIQDDDTLAPEMANGWEDFLNLAQIPPRLQMRTQIQNHLREMQRVNSVLTQVQQTAFQLQRMASSLIDISNLSEQSIRVEMERNGIEPPPSSSNDDNHIPNGSNAQSRSSGNGGIPMGSRNSEEFIRNIRVRNEVELHTVSERLHIMRILDEQRIQSGESMETYGRRMEVELTRWLENEASFGALSHIEDNSFRHEPPTVQYRRILTIPEIHGETSFRVIINQCTHTEIGIEAIENEQ